MSFTDAANLIYSLVADLAISLFLVFYPMMLVTQARKVTAVQSVSLPVWFEFMYPNWLDRLTFRQIAMAFVWGLGIAIISWIALAVVLLAILGRLYGS
jgi:hypothetical protein